MFTVYICVCLLFAPELGMRYLCSSYLLLYRVAVSCPVRTIMLLVYRCCFPIASASTELLPDCIRFSCCSLITAAAPLLCLPQLLLPASAVSASRLCPLQLLLPYCVRFSCCSPIVSASQYCIRFNCCSPMASPPVFLPNVLEHSRFEECHASLV